jgi:hypothetical protein
MYWILFGKNELDSQLLNICIRSISLAEDVSFLEILFSSQIVGLSRTVVRETQGVVLIN